MNEQGSGSVSASVGFLIFLGMLLAAVQVLFNLYATSVVTSVGFDAARRVAGSGGNPAVMAEVEADARHSLGRYSERVVFDWSGSNRDIVVLTIRARNPGFTLPALAGPSAFATIDRTMRVRVERFR